jgi:hypothetical protein
LEIAMDQLLSSQPFEDSSPRQNTRRMPGGPDSPRGQQAVPRRPEDRTTDDNIVIRAPLGRYVRPGVAAAAVGLTVKAIERKIEDGKWIEGREYRRAPDGRIYIDMRGFEKWVETEAA